MYFMTQATRAFLVLALCSASSPLISKESKASPVAGTWKLTSDWKKGGEKGKGLHVVTLQADRSGSIESGTIRDVKLGGTSSVRKLKVKGNSIRFTFFYSEKEEYEIE
ncbi:MAG: hypothetical protein AAF517_26125, partial [Planctomycetota bacterium]